MLDAAKAIDQWAFQYAQYLPTKISSTFVSLSNSTMGELQGSGLGRRRQKLLGFSYKHF